MWKIGSAMSEMWNYIKSFYLRYHAVFYVGIIAYLLRGGDGREDYFSSEKVVIYLLLFLTFVLFDYIIFYFSKKRSKSK
ncbi:hypothetical protein GCM10011273_15900 [Asticcacaulis endophyticus]|uniref:Uncharacterized protein n=1 Tax=Asticcacaulis endophyticus TaxID=1395890 RepID=A0A918Q177_9CAUL|nr:hypothetical protein GCM10011273_15900 [Asticcacaulis endophyticus]